MKNVNPVILSGGSGTRLWPLSRPLYPKQFLPLHSNNTLFQETALRLGGLDIAPPIIISNQEHRFIVAENMQKIGFEIKNIILEPVGRNTAPAIAVAALYALKNNDDAILLVLPADHVIEDVKAFENAVKLAADFAGKGHMVTFGIKPTHAHTGYGYIEAGNAIKGNQGSAFELVAFKEKPDLQTAESFVESGKYLWNSGMFCFKAKRFLEELEKYHPNIIEHAQDSLDNSQKDMDFVRLNKDDFVQCADISIDYAVMEHTKHGAVVSLAAGWNDIGSWDALWQVNNKDANHNAIKGDVIAHSTTNSFIHGTDKLVCTLGLDNTVIIDTQDIIANFPIIGNELLKISIKHENIIINLEFKIYKIDSDGNNTKGEHGGKIIASGTPEKIIATKRKIISIIAYKFGCLKNPSGVSNLKPFLEIVIQ